MTMRFCLRHSRSNKPVAWCLAGSVLLLAGCEEPLAPEVPIRPVISMLVGDVVKFTEQTYPGRAKPTQEVNISFEVSGRMIKRQVDVGDSLKKGDVLAELEADRYEAEVGRLKAERASAQAELENAEKQLARQAKLLEDGFSTQARVDELVAAVRSTRSQSDAISAALDRAEIDRSHTVVYAPFDGTVSETFVEEFQNVVAKQPVLRILDTSQIEMDVNVPEALIGLTSYVTEIRVRFKPLPGLEIPASIKEIGNEASLTTRTYPVTIVMDQPEGAEIRPGMAGEAVAVVELPEDLVERGVEVPVAALFSPDDASSDEAFVWIVEEAGSVVSRRQVTVLTTSGRGVRITGVNTGDRIVTAGASYLTDGQPVRLLQQ